MQWNEYSPIHFGIDNVCTSGLSDSFLDAWSDLCLITGLVCQTGPFHLVGLYHMINALYSHKIKSKSRSISNPEL